jgi:putative PIG3 family NAD(P)H quinone oxidoreductase
MKAIAISRSGGPEVLDIVEREKPAPGAGEILVRVEAIGVNRPDVQQRRGLYPSPPGASDLPGLDIAGTVEALGADVRRWAVGDTVCALANGGGYAEFCTVPAVQAMPIPKGLSVVEGASLPEVFFTAWNNVVWLGRLARGERLMVQGGTSGVGIAALQIARTLFDAETYATAGSEEKRDVCRQLGVTAAVDYRAEDWPQQLLEAAGGKGMHVILDGQAGPYTQKQLDLLDFDGRLVLIASHLGETAEVNVRQIVRRRLTLTGSTLRPRDAAYKGRIADELVERVWPELEAGTIVTRIHKVFAFDQMREAHAMLDRNEQIGKIVVRV